VIETERLDLIPTSVDLLEAELERREQPRSRRFAELLGARVPRSCEPPDRPCSFRVAPPADLLAVAA